MEHKNIQKVNQNLETVLTNARFQFALESLQIILREKPTESFFFSPHSIYEILCIIYLGSTEITNDYLGRKVLHLSDVSKANLAQHYAQHRCSSHFEPKDETMSYTDDTKCWITNSKMLSDAVQHLFKSKMEIVNFHKQFSKDLLDRISTNIRRSLPYSFDTVELTNITENMEIILMTVLNFRATYEYVITGHENITSSSRKKERSLMSTKIGMLMNEISYNENLSMYFLFPATLSETNQVKLNENIPLLVKKLASKIGMDELRKMLHSKESDLHERIIRLKPFKFENNLPIVELLRFFNVEELVNSDEANLHEFVVEGEQPLHLGGAYHRACINLTQQYATIASAVTMFFTKHEASFSSMRKNIRNNSSLSFILLIYDKKCCKILFIGVIRRVLQLADENSEDKICKFEKNKLKKSLNNM